MATLATVRADIRSATDHDSDTQVTDAQLDEWTNQEYQVLRRRLVDLVPDLYTAVSADFTLGPGVSSMDLAGAPLSLANFSKPRVVERKISGEYLPLPLTPFVMGGIVPYLSWRQRGAATIDFKPVLSAPGTYRVRYLTKPEVLTGSNPVDLPDGGERILSEKVAARVRVRMEEDPSPHVAFADAAWKELHASLVRMYPTTPSAIIDLSGRW